MDFTLDTEQKALRDAVRDMVGRWDFSDAVGTPRFDAKAWQSLAEMGLLALPFEEGAGPVEVMLVAQELGRARVRSPYAETLLAGHLLHEAGHDLLEQVGEGTALVMPAITEPGRAWGAAPMTSALQIDGEADGGWELSGTKAPVPYAEVATHVVVDTDSGTFLVESPTLDAAGSTLTLDGTAATLLTADPAAAQRALNHATLVLCAEALGAMESALAMTVDYLKSRKQFGVPLMTFQTLTQRAAVMYVQQELARSAVEYCAMTLADGPDDAEAAATASRTKAVVGKAGRLIGQEAIQLHGGIGVTAEYAVAHLAARLTAIEHTYGDTRFHLSRLGQQLADHDDIVLLG